jgi:hypothetical protein
VSIDKAAMNYIMGQNVMQAVDEAIIQTLQFGLTQHPNGFGIHVSSSDNGPKIEFFTTTEASLEVAAFCSVIASNHL